MTASVLIDASNLIAGGGVQVGASFIDELGRRINDPAAQRRWPWLADVVVEASDVVMANTTGSLSVRVVNGRPAARLRQLRGQSAYDVSFTVFGPDYGPRRARTRIVGFADATSLFPSFAAVTGTKAQLKQAVRRRVSRRRFLLADVVVAESTYVATALQRWELPADRIRVVPNVLNQVFFDRSLQLPLAARSFDHPVLAFPTRAYPHKNLIVLGAAARILNAEHGRDVRFALTLTEREWGQLDTATKEVSHNVGPLRVAQVPSLYDACDAVVFPSLNECFSVTPLEAMVSRRPLVASDRQFVREVAGDAAWYFEPTDPASLASALAALLSDEGNTREPRVAHGARIADGWPTGADRATAYLDVIDGAISRQATSTA